MSATSSFSGLWQASLDPRPLRGRGKEGLVHTACACAEFRKMSIKIGSHVHGKALRMKYTEIQSTIWVELVCSSVQSSKEDSELDCHSMLEASLHIVSPSNAVKASLSWYKSPLKPSVARSKHGASKRHGLLP